MCSTTTVYVFGDESSEKLSLLTILNRRPGNSPLLANFIDQASLAVHKDLELASFSIQRPKPAFTGLIDAAEQICHGESVHPALASALLCTGQLAQVISYFENHPTASYISPHDCILGICTGSLAAAALACTESVLDFVSVAVDIVRIAFRVGFEANKVADWFHSDEGCPKSWSLTSLTSEQQAQKDILDFNEELKLLPYDSLYLSAVAGSSVTISGPPSMLGRYSARQKDSQKGTNIWLPIYAPYHAPHLHKEIDKRWILNLDELVGAESLNQHRPRTTFLSAVTGEPMKASSLTQLLDQIVNEILHHPLRLDKLIFGYKSRLRLSEPSNCSVWPVGPCKAINSLVACLRDGLTCNISLNDGLCYVKTPELGLQLDSPENTKTSPVAIVGMAGLFPGAKDTEQLWSVLEQGFDMHREVPSDRFDVDAHVDPKGKVLNTSHTPFGCFIDDPGLFDARFFNMSPREARQTDPMQRLALTTAYHALEMAGYVPNRTPSTKLDRIGTFFGQTSDDYREMNAAQDVDTYFITGGIRAFGPGRINYHFKFSGPSYNVDTACSSSMAAIQLACTTLWQNECDTAVAGGLSILTSPDLYAGLSRGHFLSKTGSCKTFDDEADGYCRGDAVATVVLKRLSDAEADSDLILGVIKGAATNHSAEAVSITHPHADTQSRLYRKVLKQAGVDALAVSYVEMHGTGTQAGDSTEMTSVSTVFAPASNGRTSSNPLYIGSVKANLGHGEAASGVTALVKSLLILEKQSIPRHVGIKGRMNRSFPNLKERNIHIPLTQVPFLRAEDRKRRILVSNFSAAGGNTALLLEDWSPKQPRVTIDPRPLHVVSVSAKTTTSLRSNTDALLEHLQKTEVFLPDLSYTTMARRAHYEYRATAVGSNIDEVCAKLKEALNSQDLRPVPSKPRIGFAFTGQGSHYPMLAKTLFKTSKIFRSEVSLLNSIAIGLGYESFLPLITGDDTGFQILSAVQLQLGNVCVQIALARLWASWGIRPDVVIGHSLGEYAAFNIAGMLSLSDIIHLVGSRALLLQTRCTAGTHAMLAVRCGVGIVSRKLEQLRSSAEIACINGPNDTVIAGFVDQIEGLASLLESENIKFTRLNIPYAFHSSQVDPILDDFESTLDSLIVHEPKIQVVSSLLAKPILDSSSITPAYFRSHAREPVNFLGAIKACKMEYQVDKDFSWIEIGPHPVCLGMLNSDLGDRFSGKASLRRNEDPWKTLTTAIGYLHEQGVLVDWNAYFNDIGGSHQLLKLPAFVFESVNYWIPYRNNWALTKGEGKVQVSESKKAETSGPATTSVQRIIQHSVEGTKISIIFESDLAEPSLHAAVRGHLVNGTGLCPSSIFADIGLTVGDYIPRLLNLQAEKFCCSVSEMHVSKPLIVDSSPKTQLLHIKLTGDFSQGYLNLEFESPASCSSMKTTTTPTYHAKCILRFSDSISWLKEWSKSAYLICSRIDILQHGGGSAVNKVSSGLAYKLFASLVDYAPPYRGMKEVTFNSQDYEATALVRLEDHPNTGNFFLKPFWIDSLVHLSGFVMNASDATDSKENVYISHGWDEMRFAAPTEVTTAKEYTVYVKMQFVEPKVVAGDVYIFEGEEVVGLCSGLRFQQIPKALLNMLLPPKCGKSEEPRILKISGTGRPIVRPEVIIPKRSAARGNQETSNDMIQRVLSLLADEIGLPVDELTKEKSFASLGVDSLLTLSIVGRLQAVFNIELPSTIFMDHPTIGNFQQYLQGYIGQSKAIEVIDEDLIAPNQGFISSDTTQRNSPRSSLVPSGTTTPISQYEGDEQSLHLRLAIARETGIPVEEINESTRLDAIGLDSIMALSIMAQLEGQQADLGHTAIFKSHTVGELEQNLGFAQATPIPSFPKKIDGEFQSNHFSASSVILQGNPGALSGKSLFLFPDGSGSAGSYAKLPSLSSAAAVIGLNSPFLRNPETYTCGIPALVRLYLDEIKRIQPRGPYSLGGWSIGGIIAFEAACQLLNSGEEVENLVLIDSPCPTVLAPLPHALISYFDSIGLFDKILNKCTKYRLFAHFSSSVANLHNYKSIPLPASTLRKPLSVTIIWAKEGIRAPPGSPEPKFDERDSKTAQFMLSDRTEVVGGWGWEELLTSDKKNGSRVKLSIMKVDGNHFSMMDKPLVQHVGRKIEAALEI